jgi:hypothetical protein
VPIDEEDFESIETSEPNTRRQRLAGMELLAVYRPFHRYPEGEWGIHFFESPMKWYTNLLFRKCNGRIPWTRVLKIATYSVARHEFMHYLTELEALRVELTASRRVYLPYQDQVYWPSFPGRDCIEETVANVWAWENDVVRRPRFLQDVVRAEMKRMPWPAYAQGGVLTANRVRPVEDRLNAQLQQCVRKPRTIPSMWGMLPRPYHQPWTHYKNVRFMMNRSAGGVLGPILSAKPIRPTIRIFHV